MPEFDDIQIYELKRINLKGATVIDGFPSVGLVSTITANYLVNTLKLEQIGIMDSIHFPTLSLIRKSEPLNTVRIYAGERVGNESFKTSDSDGDQVVVFISEFQPPTNLIKKISSTILDWIQEQRCKVLISPEGLLIDDEDDDTDDTPDAGAVMSRKDKPELEKTAPEPVLKKKKKGRPPKGLKGNGEEAAVDGKDSEKVGEAEADEDITAYGVGSTPAARALLEKNKIPLFEEGVITGIAGVLLNEGRRRDFDVISILARAHPNYPDAKAAAKVIEAINKLFLHIKLDPEPLYKEAESIESQIKAIQKQAKGTQPAPVPLPRMYG